MWIHQVLAAVSTHPSEVLGVFDYNLDKIIFCNLSIQFVILSQC